MGALQGRGQVVVGRLFSLNRGLTLNPNLAGRSGVPIATGNQHEGFRVGFRPTVRRREKLL